jgi:hypothetical protein
MESEKGGVVARSWTEPEAKLLRFFRYDHLPVDLQAVSKPIGDLAVRLINESSGPSAELTAGLRKLIEAKDCFVRASLPE